MVCDIMLDRLSDAAGLGDGWELGEDGFHEVGWFPRE
jgi:hypothetical protein